MVVRFDDHFSAEVAGSWVSAASAPCADSREKTFTTLGTVWASHAAAAFYIVNAQDQGNDRERYVRLRAFAKR